MHVVTCCESQHADTMAPMSRLNLALRQLLRTQRVAALGSLGTDGMPHVSMVPYAIDPSAAALVIHVSALAAHSGNMARCPAVSLMVMQAERADEPVHALARVSLQGRAETIDPASASWQTARQVYLARFPEAQAMLQLGDFRLMHVRLDQARHIAGFGAARSVDGAELAKLLSEPTD